MSRSNIKIGLLSSFYFQNLRASRLYENHCILDNKTLGHNAKLSTLLVSYIFDSQSVFSIQLAKEIDTRKKKKYMFLKG